MKRILLVVGIIAVARIQAAPTDSKNIEDNEIPTKVLTKGVSAEFGGYKASAGLGGSENGGALYASATGPDSGANAGLFGGGPGAAVGAEAGASTNYGSHGGKPPNGHDYGFGKPQHQAGGQGFFDRIFAIPISVLYSVNDFVKTRPVQKPFYTETAVGGSTGGAGAAAGAGVGAGVTGDYGSTEVKYGAGQGAHGAGASASASASSASYHGKHVGNPDYDRIFNIPISALRSVNELLNG